MTFDLEKAKQAIDNPESDLQQWLENALDEIERQAARIQELEKQLEEAHWILSLPRDQQIAEGKIGGGDKDGN